MFLHEATSRNNWTISNYHHIQIECPALRKVADISLEIRLLSVSIWKFLIKTVAYNLTMYCIIIFSSQHCLTWPNNKICIVPSPYIALPLVCPGLFYSTCFPILFLTCISKLLISYVGVNGKTASAMLVLQSPSV